MYLISNSWSKTRLTFHFPEATQHNFVLKSARTRIAPTPHRTKTILTTREKDMNRTNISPIM